MFDASRELKADAMAYLTMVGTWRKHRWGEPASQVTRTSPVPPDQRRTPRVEAKTRADRV